MLKHELRSMTKVFQSKEFDPGMSSVEGQCANYFTLKSSVIEVIFK